MPRRVRVKPTPENKSKFEVKRSQALPIMETGDPIKDGALWQSRIIRTLNSRINSENGDRAWAAYYAWFAGDQWLHEGNKTNGDWELYSDTVSSVYTNNIVQSQASAFMPFLLNGEIKFKAKPRRPQDVNAAEIHTSLLNYEWRERSMTEIVKTIRDDVVIIGHGIGKTGWITEVDEAKRKSQGSIEYRDYVKKDVPYIERVSPFDFVFDLSARDGTLKTARWCAERSYHPLADLLANKKYDKDVLEMISVGGSPNVSMRSGFGNPTMNDKFFQDDLMVKTPEDSLVAIWTIWDKKFKKVITIPEGLPHPMLVEEWPYSYLDGFPFVMIPFLKNPQGIYPIGLARQLKDAQLQSNRIRTQEIQDVRARKSMYGYDTNKVKKEAVKDFADLPNLSAIPMQGENGIFPIQNPPASREALILERSIAADAQRATGADAIFQGEPLQDRVTAGEVGVRTNLLRLKADDKISNMERGVTDLARQILQHLKANRIQKDVVEIAGLLGSQWREYTHDEIQAETDVEVNYFSSPRYDPAVERDQRLRVGQLATQMAGVMNQQGQGGPSIDLPQVFAFIVDSFDDVKDAGRFFKESLVVPPPLEEQQPGAQQPGAGEGLPPAIAGQLAPQQLPERTTVENPFEGNTLEDLLMGTRGRMQ